MFFCKFFKLFFMIPKMALKPQKRDKQKSINKHCKRLKICINTPARLPYSHKIRRKIEIFKTVFSTLGILLMSLEGSFCFPPPTSHELQYVSVTSGFTRLSMKTKYVCRGLISVYANFHKNRTMWSTNLNVKICRWGEKEKEPARDTIKNSEI